MASNARLKDFKNFNDFFKYNFEELFSNYYVHYHFLTRLEDLNKGVIQAYRGFNVIDDEGNNIIFIWISGCCYLYSNGWTQEMISVLSEEIKFLQFKKHFEFAGEKELITEVLNTAKVNYKLFKDRLVYQITKTKPVTREINGEVSNASIVNFEDVLALSMQNYHEEYDGKGERTEDQMAASIMSGLNKGNLYVLQESGSIASIVQVISSEEDKPIIGNLFTKKDNRNKGYAFKLLHTIAEGLLNNGYEDLGLFSDKSNPASNAVFVKIGFEPIYNLGIFYKTDSPA